MTDELAGQYIEHKEDRKLGHGYNRFTANPSPSPAVVGTTGQPKEGQGVSSGIDTKTDLTELHQFLGVDVDVSGSYMGASASAKMQYTRELDSSTYSMYVVIWVKVDDSFKDFDEPVLHQDATALLKTKNNGDRFHDRFGDYWISGVSYGGEFFATYQITATSQEQREDMAAEVKAAYNGVVASVDLNASFDKKSKDSQNRVEVRLVEFRQGAVTHADLDLDAVKETAKAFPQLVRENPYPYRVKLEAYTALKLPQDDFDFYQNQKQSDVLADLAKKRIDFMALRDDIRYMLTNLKDFMNADGSDVDKVALGKTYDDVVTQLNALTDSASVCSRDASKCEFTQAEVAKYVLPVPRPKDAINVVSLVGLRGSTIRSILDAPTRPYGEYLAWCDATYEAGEVALKPSAQQYEFLTSGIKVEGQHLSIGISGFWSWVYAQAPDSGTVPSGATVTVTTKLESGGHPPADLRHLWGL